MINIRTLQYSIVFLTMFLILSCKSDRQNEFIQINTQLDSIKSILINQINMIEREFTMFYALNRKSESLKRIVNHEAFINETASNYINESSNNTSLSQEELEHNFLLAYSKIISVVKDSMKIEYLKYVNLSLEPAYYKSNLDNRFNKLNNELFILQAQYKILKFLTQSIHSEIGLHDTSNILADNKCNKNSVYSANIFLGENISSLKEEAVTVTKILHNGKMIDENIEIKDMNSYTTLSFTPNQTGVYELFLKHTVFKLWGDTVVFENYKRINVN